MSASLAPTSSETQAMDPFSFRPALKPSLRERADNLAWSGVGPRLASQRLTVFLGTPSREANSARLRLPRSSLMSDALQYHSFFGATSVAAMGTSNAFRGY